MNDGQFTAAIQKILDGARANPQLMTGLPAIDEANEQLRFTRALEILDKAIELESGSSPDEKKAQMFLDKIEGTRKELKAAITKHWAMKRAATK